MSSPDRIEPLPKCETCDADGNLFVTRMENAERERDAAVAEATRLREALEDIAANDKYAAGEYARVALEYYESREQYIADRCKALRSLADTLEEEGGHVGTVAHYRSLADGLAKAHRILRDGQPGDGA